MELGMEAGPVTKIRYRRVCEKPVDLLLNLGTRSKVTIYTYSEGPMGIPPAQPPLPGSFYGITSMGRRDVDYCTIV